jgi:hypothetical protein
MLCVFAGGPAWSSRTIRKQDEIEQEESTPEAPAENRHVMRAVLDALLPFKDAYAAVIRALEREAEKERKT